MKYFFDTEFIEGFHKPWFGKRRHFIDLISIAIVAEDGREYFAISNEWNWNKASDWVKKNVILPLYYQTVSGDARNQLSTDDFHLYYGKSNNQIAREIELFVNPQRNTYVYYNDNTFYKKHNIKTESFSTFGLAADVFAQPEFYAYYADYDWVLFCSLFGKMIDLPKGFPKYCHDLKQTIDEHAENLITKGWGTHSEGNKQYAENMKEALSMIKAMPGYPVNENEHDCLWDARFNFNLYKFLNNIK